LDIENLAVDRAELAFSVLNNELCVFDAFAGAAVLSLRHHGGEHLAFLSAEFFVSLEGFCLALGDDKAGLFFGQTSAKLADFHVRRVVVLTRIAVALEDLFVTVDIQKQIHELPGGLFAELVCLALFEG